MTPYQQQRGWDILPATETETEELRQLCRVAISPKISSLLTDIHPAASREANIASLGI